MGVLAFITGVGLLSACAARPAPQAGAPAPAAADEVQSYEPTPEPGAEDDTVAVMSLDQAAASFEQAESQISEMLAAATAPPAPDDSEVDEPGAASPAKPAPRRLNEYADGPQRCHSVCRALASMQRSASRLCELTGGDDPRCDDVRGRVEQARQLVLDACPSCIVARPTDE